MRKLKVFRNKTIATISLLAIILTACGYTPPEPVPAEEITYTRNLTPEILQESLKLGTQFLIKNQLKEGNFNYEYDFQTKTFNEDDNQVRQAGALWGIALIHRENPTPETREAAIKGIEFFDKNSIETTHAKWIVYPGDQTGKTGTVALASLALLEYLQSELSIENREEYENQLRKYLNFLLSLRLENGQFYGSYDPQTGRGKGAPSPYFDGETLLALTKATKYNEELEELLKETVLDSAESMYEINVEEALDKNPDSDTTKGFYQWGSMAYYEIYTTDWDPAKTSKFAEYAIDLAYWMIDVHKTLARTRNTAYAHEGLVSAWELARLTGNTEAVNKIGPVIDQGLYRMTTWQVGSSIQNGFLQINANPKDTQSIGGVMNSRDESPLRIDVAQHQMHAVILALDFIYQPPKPQKSTEPDTPPSLLAEPEIEESSQ